MPRSPINEVIVGRGSNGVTFNFGASTVGDDINGMYVPSPLDGMVLHVQNGNVASKNVQFIFSASCAFEGQPLPGLTLGRTIAIPGGGTVRWFSGFDAAIYENLIAGVTVNGVTVTGLQVNVNSTDISLRVFRLPSAVQGA